MMWRSLWMATAWAALLPLSASAVVIESYENGLDNVWNGWTQDPSDVNAPTIETSTDWATDGTTSAKFTLQQSWNWVWNYHEVVASAADLEANQFLSFDFNVVSGQFKLGGLAAQNDFGWRQQDAWNNALAQPGGPGQILPLPTFVTGENRGYGVFLTGDTGTFVWDYKAAGFEPTTFDTYANFAIAMQGPAGSVIHLDNFRVSGAPPVPPQYIATTVFSWETPDNPATGDVNEQFEGWQSGFSTDHVHSISTKGATDGTFALQIDRTGLANGFTWGSEVSYNAADGPADQQAISNLVNLLNGAHAIEFDVTYDDFLNTPSWTKFGLHITDQRGEDVFPFFQAEGNFIDGLPAPGTEFTVRIPLASMVDVSDAQLGTLADVGLNPATQFLRIGMSVNTDGGGLYQIDNFRVLRGLQGDFNGDNVVDAADFAAWEDAFGAADGLDGGDLLAWQREFGTSLGATATSQGVPEPATAALVAGCVLLGGFRRRRS